MDIKVEMYVSSIKELKKVLEEIKETKRNNPEEKFRFYIRVEKFGNVPNIVNHWLDGETNVEDFAEAISRRFQEYLEEQR